MTIIRRSLLGSPVAIMLGLFTPGSAGAASPGCDVFKDPPVPALKPNASPEQIALAYQGSPWIKYLNDQLVNIESFWQGQFGGNGAFYLPITRFDSGRMMFALNIGTNWPPTYKQPNYPPQKAGGRDPGYSGGIQISPPYIVDGIDYSKVTRINNDFAHILSLAHEFGHHVAWVGGRSVLFARAKDVNAEHEADRLAGVYIRHLVDTHQVPRACYDVILKAAYAAGDGPNPTDPHGTPDERVSCV